MVAAAGAGPRPVPHKQLNLENLTEGLKYCLSSEASAAAASIAEKMRVETGVKAAVQSFHRNLPLEEMKCCICDEEVAVWTYTKKGVKMRLSNRAAQILIDAQEINPKKLQM